MTDATDKRLWVLQWATDKSFWREIATGVISGLIVVGITAGVALAAGVLNGNPQLRQGVIVYLVSGTGLALFNAYLTFLVRLSRRRRGVASRFVLAVWILGGFAAATAGILLLIPWLFGIAAR